MADNGLGSPKSGGATLPAVVRVALTRWLRSNASPAVPASRRSSPGRCSRRRCCASTLRSDGFGESWPIEQPGEIITLLFVPPGEPIVLPLRGWIFPPGTQPQEWRNYTVRRHRRERGEIDVDVVLHESPGPASTWAAAGPARRRRRLRGPARRLRPARRRRLAAAVRRRERTARDRRDPRDAARGRRRRRGHRGARRHRRGPARRSARRAAALGAPRRGAAGDDRAPRRRAARAAAARRARARHGAPRNRASRATCARCCATSAECRARTRMRAATGCAPATGSTTRAEHPLPTAAAAGRTPARPGARPRRGSPPRCRPGSAARARA